MDDIDKYINDHKDLLKAEPSQLESIGRGLVQGVYPLIDETIGAVESPVGAIKSLKGLMGEDVSSDPDVQKYTQARDEYRRLDELAKQANPKTFGVSEGVGILGTFMVPGAVAGKVGKAAEIAEKAYKFGEKPLEAARFAKELARDIGIASGQVAASTEADLSRGQSEAFKSDVELGAALGALGRSTAEFFPKAYKTAEGIAVIGKPLEALRKGGEGVLAFTEKQRKNIIDKFMSGAKLTIKELEDLRSLLGEGIGTIESQAAGRGTEFNIGDIIKRGQETIENIPTSGLNVEAKGKLKGTLGKFLREETPEGGIRTLEQEPMMKIQQAQATKRDLQNLSTDLSEKMESGAFEKSMSPKISQTASQVTKEIEKTIPELGVLNKAYRNVLGVYEDLGLPKEAINLMETNPKAALDVHKELINAVEAMQDTSKKGMFTRKALDNAIAKIKQIPEVGEELGDKIANRMDKLVEDFQFQRKLAPSQEIGAQVLKGLSQGANLIGYTGNALLKQLPEYVAEKLPISREAIKTIEKEIPEVRAAIGKSIPTSIVRSMATSINEEDQPKEVSKNLYTSTNDELTSLSNSLSQSPDTKYLGDSLNKAIINNDIQAKNAALFAIAQNPKARKYYNDLRVK